MDRRKGKKNTCPCRADLKGIIRFSSARTLVGAERFDEASSDARDLCNAHAETRFFMKFYSAGLNALKPWRRDMGCIPSSSPARRMCSIFMPKPRSEAPGGLL